MSSLAQRTYVALLHHPVVDRNGRVVTTALTNLDIHDIARASRTFGLAAYYLVTPVTAQRELAGRILAHWTAGEGRRHNAKRTDALETVRVAASLAEVRDAVRVEACGEPFVVATGARERPGDGLVGYQTLPRDLEKTARPLLLLFGTGWGLTEEVFASADGVLPPISGGGSYNHLSVRAAVAIVLDRLFGNRSDHV